LILLLVRDQLSSNQFGENNLSNKKPICAIIAWIILIICIVIQVWVIPSIKLGKETDAHGCLITAGYQWCESKQKCIRFFEEPCN